MDLQILFHTLHLVGMAVGVGGATASDYLFFRSARDRKISSDEFNLLQSMHRVLWIGLALLIFSGAGMLAVQYVATGSIAVSGAFFAKMTIVLILLFNGFAFKKLVFPVLKACVNRPLHQDSNFVAKLWPLSLVGAISIVSWYGALLLGALRALELPPYLFVMTLYAFLVSGGATFGYLFLSHLVFAPRHKVEQGKTERAPLLRLTGVLIVGAIVLLVGAAFYFL